MTQSIRDAAHALLDAMDAVYKRGRHHADLLAEGLAVKALKDALSAPQPTADERIAEHMRMIDEMHRHVGDSARTASAREAVEQSARVLLSASQEDAEHAAMYRWLRSQHESESTEALCVFGPGGIHSLDPIGSMPGELDAAIRAAMSAKEPK